MDQNSKKRAEHLEDAFNLFNQVSERLAGSYQVLEQRVAQLSAELSAAHSERLQELAEKERLATRLEHLLAVLPGGVVVLDAAEVIQECNPVAQELLGEQLLQQPWRRVAQRIFRSPMSDGGDIQLANGRVINIVTRALGPDQGTILLLNDVTENRALQERLNRHKRLSSLGEMAARLAHQIRTPLTAAMLYLSHLSRPALEANKQQRFLHKSQRSLRHLEGLVNDMLVFARGGSVGHELIVLDELLETFYSAVEPLVQEHEASLKIINDAPDARLHGNRDALLGALQNLAMNAVQACGKGAALVLQCLPSMDGTLEIRFTDNGPGIPEALQDKILEPFYTTKSQGTGLGLAVVLAVVRAHNGSLEVESEDGRGTSFVMHLPAADGSVSEIEPESVANDVDNTCFKESAV